MKAARSNQERFEIITKKHMNKFMKKRSVDHMH